MAFQNMVQDVLGTFSGMNRGLAATRINEAFLAIQNENAWSFQLQTGGWLTPGLLGSNGRNGVVGTNFASPGTITVSPYSITITGDPVSTAAWVATIPNPPFITQYQIRVPYYSLYSIIALGNNGTIAYMTISSAGSGQTPGVYTVPVTDNAGPGASGSIEIVVNMDGTVTETPVVLNAGSGYISPAITFSEGGVAATFLVTLIATLTLDRPWMEPAQVNSPYMAYQAYFALPPGFTRLLNARDTTNNNQMDFWTKTQQDLANEDAERTIFDEPLYIVQLGPDTRAGSATYGQFLVELWPGPITQLPYTFFCQCNWPLFQNPTDTVPYPLTEELVRQRAYEMCCLWKEGSKGDEMERGSGANWQFLTGAYRAEYNDRLKRCRNMDRNLVDLYFTKMQRLPSTYEGDGYATITGQLNVGF